MRRWTGIAVAVSLMSGATDAQLRPRPTSTASATPPQALKLPHTLTVMSVKSETYTIRLLTTPDPIGPMTCTIVAKDVYPQGRGATICKFKFAGGTKVQLTATKIDNASGAMTPVADWQWTNDCAGTKGIVCELVMNKDRTAEMTPGLL